MDNDHTDMSCHITYCSQLSGMSIFISSDILPHLRDKPDNGDNKCMEIAVPMNVQWTGNVIECNIACTLLLVHS